MTTMGSVWDRTVAVLEGRGNMLAGIAALAVFLPTVARAAAQSFTNPASPGAVMLAGLISIAAVVVAVWGHLALLAAASDPAVLRGDAGRMATRRLLPAIGLALVIFLAIVVVLMPLGVIMMRSGVDMQAVAASGSATMPAQLARPLALYSVVFLLVSLAVATRLVLLYPIVLLERRGLGAFARSLQLTRGIAWRVLGVLVLYAVVLFVAAGAARMVVGSVAALVLGPSATAAFLAAVAAALVGAALSVVAIVFTAQLYVARREAIDRP